MRSCIFLIFINLLIGCRQKDVFFVTDFGAVGDGKTLNTAAIQKAIDKACVNGGKVYIPQGVFLSGTIELKSNVTLELAGKAVLLGSPDIHDYKEISWGHNNDRQPYHLLYARNIKNITICGTGIIDGNGEAFWEEYEKDKDGKMVTPRWLKPKEKKVSPLIELTESEDIIIRDITVKTGGGWNIHLLNCNKAFIQGVKVLNNLFSPNSDGIDITGSTDVIISDCYIKTCDDAICLKTVPDSRECRRITVTNCILETLCVGLKLGCNESFKDITDVTFSNCIINSSSRAIGLYVWEGATYENITINNIVANTNAPLVLNRPIQIMVDNREPNGKKGCIRNVFISNFICTTEGRILLTASDGNKIENIVFRDVMLNYPMIEDPSLYGDSARSNQYPKIKKHPEAVIAKAAIVADNVKNLVIDNFIVNWPDADTIPSSWKFPERIENGSKRIHREDYSKSRQTDFSVLWGNKLNGGYFCNRLAYSSNLKLAKYNIKESSVKIIE